MSKHSVMQRMVASPSVTNVHAPSPAAAVNHVVPLAGLEPEATRSFEDLGRVAQQGHRFEDIPTRAPAAAGNTGRALPGPLRAKMEAALDHNFAPVRVHQDGNATLLGASAYTRGYDLHFAPGQYQPQTAAGQALIGHELTHVVQQDAGNVAAPQGKGAPINADPVLEAEADKQGARAASGEIATVRGVGGGVQRKALLGPAGVIQCGRPVRPPSRFRRRLRVSTEAKTVKISQKFGKRTTKAAAKAGYKDDSLAKISIDPKFLEAEHRGTYGHQRLVGDRINMLPSGARRARRILVEADHMPTDGSQRGDLARDDPQNRVATLSRPAATLPKSLHRLHPTTRGGRNHDPNIALAQKGFVDNGKYFDAIQLHLEEYRKVLRQGAYGKNLHEGMVSNINDMLWQHKEQKHIDENQRNDLIEAAKDIFGWKGP